MSSDRRAQTGLTRLRSGRVDAGQRLVALLIGVLVATLGGLVLATAEGRAALDPATAAGPSPWTEAMRCEAAGMLESPDRAPEQGIYWSFVARVEQEVIREALKQSGGNQIQAAQRLGINRNTLRKKIELLGLKDATLRDPSP